MIEGGYFGTELGVSLVGGGGGGRGTSTTGKPGTLISFFPSFPATPPL